MYTNFHCCHSLGCLVTYTIALYYNVWPEVIFQCETESKGLTNFLVTLHILPPESTTVQKFRPSMVIELRKKEKKMNNVENYIF